MRALVLLTLASGMLLASNSMELLDKGNMHASKKEYKKAYNYFKQAADQNNSEAMYNIAYLYGGGFGVAFDLKQSAFWYEQAAKNGHINSQINLGFMYIGGQGVDKDLKKAAYWINEAKKANHPKALILWEQFDLSSYY